MTFPERFYHPPQTMPGDTIMSVRHGKDQVRDEATVRLYPRHVCAIPGAYP